MSLEKIDILFKFLEQNNALDIDVPERFRCKKCIRLLRNSCQVQCGCRYCLNCVNDMILNGQLVCHGRDEDCGYGDLLNVSKDFIFNKEISKLVVKCPSKKCFHECELRDLYEHIENCVKKNLDCLFNRNRCNEMTMHSSCIIEHLQTQIQNSTNIMTEMMEKFENKFNQKIAENKNEINILKQQVILSNGKIQLITEETKLIKKEISELVKHFEILKKEIDERFNKLPTRTQESKRITIQQSPDITRIFARMNSFEMKLNLTLSESEKCMKLINGDIFIWIIDKYDPNITRHSICSQSFRTTTKPYSVKLVSYPNGYGDMKNTHLTIFIYIYYSSSDEYTTWPFMSNVTIMISNKSNPQVLKSIQKLCVIEKPRFGSYKYSDPFDFSLADLKSAGISLDHSFIVEYLNEFV